ncbi:MAG: TlpA family protein disulfide reductase [Bacteroidetes bacterium]|nr:TlpA family protein disulfide reductase [Bacteroidota bacterium]
MNFIKKNIIYLLLSAGLLVVFSVPGILDKIKTQFFPIATIEQAITITDADYDIELKGINVPDSNLKNFKNKNLFLNFWGTWCPPCRTEWPTIQALYNSKKNEIDFVLIAMQDEEENVMKFLKENQYTVPVYIAQSPVSEKILPKAFPTTFLINKNGNILFKEDASKDWNSKDAHRLIEAMKE